MNSLIASPAPQTPRTGLTRTNPVSAEGGINVLALDLSHNGHIHITRNGALVPLERAFEEGVFITREDSNVVLQLISNFLKARDVFSNNGAIQ